MPGYPPKHNFNPRELQQILHPVTQTEQAIARIAVNLIAGNKFDYFEWEDDLEITIKAALKSHLYREVK